MEVSVQMLVFRSIFATSEMELVVLIDLPRYKVIRYKMTSTKWPFVQDDRYKILQNYKIQDDRYENYKIQDDRYKFKMTGANFQKSARKLLKNRAEK